MCSFRYGSLVPCTNLETILCVTLNNDTTDSISSNNNLNNSTTTNNEIIKATTKAESSTAKSDPLELERQKEMIFIRDFLRARPLVNSGDVIGHPFYDVTKNDFEHHERDFSDPNLELKSIPPHIYVNSNGTLIISGKVEPKLMSNPWPLISTPNVSYINPKAPSTNPLSITNIINYIMITNQQ